MTARLCQELLVEVVESDAEALDRGVEFPVPPDELCSRCKSVMSTLDLTFDACRQLNLDSLPESLRQSILEETSKL